MADGSGVPNLDLSLHEKQTEAFLSPATEILYGGAAGGGKSHLLRVLAIALCSDIPGLQVYLFRRISDDLYKNHMVGEGGFYELLGPWMKEGLVKFNAGKSYLEFWNRARIWLSHCQYEKDVAKYQGPEIHVLLIDELTHFTKTIYVALRARCRTAGLKVPPRYKGKLPLIVAGSNPGGVGHNWVKQMWVTPHKPMTVWQAPKKDGGMLRQFIPALLSDNPTMDSDSESYLDKLEGLGNKALVEAMKNGNWDIVSGGALDDVWTPRAIIPRFRVPASWRVDRSFDWGSSRPFSVLIWAEADGSEASYPHPTEYGAVVKFCPPRGSLILIGEWYGGKPNEPNVGLMLPPRAIAKGVKTICDSYLKDLWVHRPVEPGPADNQINTTMIPGVPSIATEMENEGVRWEPSDKSPGSRKTGLDLMRAMLIESGKPMPEARGLWVMDHCRQFIAHIPVLPRNPDNPDDIDTEAEDHDYDAARYRILSVNATAQVQDLNF